ncbi:unnamed protein product [Rotaria socialis]|uniref:G-protein coupled receptors family 2 profile 2 domain-containing protein n=1 Tax=Rotaria socialis TaxID=392032 RepID=A0A818HD81_9BILA|nr:unnamed protein product [Rotaria socialis]CAF3506712.1 unnamed protein product [Rotaria socialis]
MKFLQCKGQEPIGQQNNTSREVTNSAQVTLPTTTSKLSIQERLQKYLKTTVSKSETMKSGNMTSKATVSNRTGITPPNNIFREYLRCRHWSSINGLPSPYACPYDFEDDIRVCWPATHNGTIATSIIEYDHGQNNFYDGVRYGIENCTLERFCQSNGSWAMTVLPDIQCKSCVGDGRPVKFNSISIMIETMSLSLSLITLTIAVFCMMNVKRLRLPRNLLHMHLFVAFIFRSIVKLVFIHLIIGGYTRTMISSTRDKCGNIEILSKSSNLFHITGCRVLSSLFWYTDAVSQTFIFCEAMFLFTALTSHLFRDRGCLPFVLWGWLSPLVWSTLWIASHIITDRLKNRSTCWLEADNTTYFYYFFYVPYALYLLVNFGIFLYLVRLLYSKYQSYNLQTNRTGNRHLIKSILILIPLFGLHSLFVIWVFYHKNQGHTIWYYISVIFKAVFGDLQGFFTSLIYFYFNTEIRFEVLRQVQRAILNNETVRLSSAGDTLSTRLSTFRRSISRHRHSSIQNRNERRRMNNTSYANSSLTKSKNKTCWSKCFTLICPCFVRKLIEKKSRQDEQPVEQNNLYEPSPSALAPQVFVIDDIGGVSSQLLVQTQSIKGVIDNDGMTCDTDLMKHEYSELLTDENDVTIQQSSFQGEQPSSSSSHHTPLPVRSKSLQRNRSNSDEHILTGLSSNHFADNRSLR